MTESGLSQRIAAALQDTTARVNFDALHTRARPARLNALAALPMAEDVRDKARAIRLATLRQLDQYLVQLEQRVVENGGQVHWASDAAEASQIVLQIVQQAQATVVTKSKSMVTEEIGLNEVLARQGIRVVETDLGEYIIQLRGDKPSHITVPAAHMNRGQVAALFAKHLGMAPTTSIEAMTATARKALRQDFLRAGVGISGVNFAVAETGTIALVTNEGNAGLTTTAPPVHVAVMGLERVVPTMADLEIMLRVLSRSATGQKISVYTDLVSGPRRPMAEAVGEPDGPDAFHLVIVDNGRSAVLAGELAESLLCIRCGACLNICPVYREIGGHAYEPPYSGPIGAVITPALNGTDEHGELAQASSLCGACQDVCPVRIDLPTLLVRIRGQHQARKPARDHDRLLDAGIRVWQWTMQSPTLYALATRLVSLGNRLLGGDLRPLAGLPLVRNWTAHRALPALPRESFRERWRRHGRTGSWEL